MQAVMAHNGAKEFVQEIENYLKIQGFL